MTENDFKKKNKPAMCTYPVWKSVITSPNKEDIVRTIRQETVQAYGYSMDACPKRLACLGDHCLGRPLPILAPTAQPYIEELKKTHKVVNNELFLSKCDQCPIKAKCTSTCHQINDFVNRHDKKEPEYIYNVNLDNHSEHTLAQNSIPFISKDIPFDCLSDRRKTVIKMYLYEGKDFAQIAKELNIKSHAFIKYEFYAGLTKLSEYATIRDYIDKNKEILPKGVFLLLEKLYLQNKSITEVANEEKCTKQAIQQRLTRILENANISWTIFVKKQKGKLVYKVPMVLK